jgi:hypothetical protein
MINNPPL